LKFHTVTDMSDAHLPDLTHKVTNKIHILCSRRSLWSVIPWTPVYCTVSIGAASEDVAGFNSYFTILSATSVHQNMVFFIGRHIYKCSSDV